MTAWLIGPMRSLGVLDQFAQDDGRQRFRAKLAAGDGTAKSRLAHAPFDEHGDAVGHVQGNVERRLADDGAAVLDQHRHWASASRRRGWAA